MASLRAVTADFLDSANATITEYADKVSPTLKLMRSGHLHLLSVDSLNASM